MFTGQCSPYVTISPTVIQLKGTTQPTIDVKWLIRYAANGGDAATFKATVMPLGPISEAEMKPKLCSRGEADAVMAGTLSG